MAKITKLTLHFPILFWLIGHWPLVFGGQERYNLFFADKKDTTNPVIASFILEDGRERLVIKWHAAVVAS